MRATKVKRQQRRVLYREGSWLRDRDLLSAWAFRVLYTALGAIILWNVTGYTKKIDELSISVPLLTNTMAALTDQLKSEQAQIDKIWNRLFDDAIAAKKK